MAGSGPDDAVPYGGAMGYNPYRKRVRRRSDIVFVGAAVVCAALLVAWALLAG